MQKDFEFGSNWFGSLSEDWSEWFSGRWNWRNFTLVKVYYEDEICMGNRELDLAFLGVCLRIVHIYNHDAEGRRLVEDRLAEWRAGTAE